MPTSPHPRDLLHGMSAVSAVQPRVGPRDECPGLHGPGHGRAHHVHPARAGIRAQTAGGRALVPAAVSRLHSAVVRQGEDRGYLVGAPVHRVDGEGGVTYLMKELPS